MSWEAKLYWLTRLDTINTIASTFMFVAVAALIIAYLVQAVTDGDWEFPLSAKIGLWALLLITLPVVLFLPTRNEAIFIVAGSKTIEYAAQDTSLQKLPGKATELVLQKLNNELDDLRNHSSRRKEEEQ